MKFLYLHLDLLQTFNAKWCLEKYYVSHKTAQIMNETETETETELGPFMSINIDQT